MATQNSSFVRRVFPTSHRKLLESEMRRRYGDYTGSGLVIGAGHDDYHSLLTRAEHLVCTDIAPVAGVQFADVHSLQFPDESFDFVIAIEVFEHLQAPATAAAEINRVLRQGGKVLLTVPFMFRVHGDPHDYTRFTESGLRELFSGFSKVKVTPFGNRTHVISDLVSTSFRILAVSRILNHLWCLPMMSHASSDSPSGYVIELLK